MTACNMSTTKNCRLKTALMPVFVCCADNEQYAGKVSPSIVLASFVIGAAAKISASIKQVAKQM